MTIDIALSTGQIALWGLFVCRATGLVLLAPVIGGQNVPVRVKAAFVLFLATLLFVVRSRDLAMLTLASGDVLGLEPLLVVFAVRELLIGLFLGMLVKAMFIPFLLAGDMIAHEMAFTMAQVVSPDEGRGLSILAVIFEFFALMMFLGLDLHHKMLELFALSFESAAPGGSHSLALWLGWFLAYFVGILKSALILVAPVFLFLLVLTLAVGLLAKTVPQMNALDFSFPTRILGALLALFAFFPEMAIQVERILTHNTNVVFAFLKQL